MLQKFVPFPPGNQAGIFIRGFTKILVRIANREDPDQTVSSEAADLGLCCVLNALTKLASN